MKRRALHKSIRDVNVGSARILRGVSAKKIKQTLKGNRFERARRHGKHLFVALDHKGWLAMHFGMTGRLKYFKQMSDDPKHDRLRFDFGNGYHLAFENQRLFGDVRLVEDADGFIAEKKLGPDALDPRLDTAAFAERLKGRRGIVKSVLMDQEVLAGIGNVYSDEFLFQAGLHPKKPAQKLDKAETAKLYRTMRRILKVAIDNGAGTEDVVKKVTKTYLLPHRRDGATRPRCGGKVKALKASGRTAYICPRCQPAP